MTVRPRSMLRPYQERIASRILQSEGLLLSIPMGLGKTAIVATAIADMIKSKPDARVLVVAPLRVANNVWPDEFRQWGHTQDLTFAVVTGAAKKRREAIKQKKSVYIINFENLRWMIEEGLGDRYDMVVIDESSRLRSGKKKTRGTNAMTTFGAAARVCTSTPKRVLLTGTMAPNGIHGLWGQAFCLDMGARLGKTRTAFERRWFDKDYMGWNLTPTPTAEAEITRLLSDVVVSLEPGDFVKLPPQIVVDTNVTLPPDSRLHYRELQRTLASLPLNCSAATRGVLQNKLLQLCNGAVYDDDGKVRAIHEEKLDALEELVESVPGENILVLYPYRFDLQMIRGRFSRSRLLSKDENIVAEWNRGEVKMLAAHPASCAHGLNLQFGGFRTVWYGLVWDLELYLQANARLRRPGQAAERCYLHHLIAKGTVEERVLQRLNEKDATQSRINDAFLDR